MKILFRVILTLLILIVCAGIFGYALLKNSVAPYEGELALKGVIEKIEITFDKKGIPQIWAENENDAYFALGWLHASERLFQMDMTRRISQGRLSEVLGEITLKMDVESRKIGHDQLVRNQIQNLSPENKARLEAYALGINTFVDETAAMPFEFYLLDYDFSPWTVYDCLTIMSFQTWYSDALQNRDLFFVEVAAELGLEKAQSALFSYPDWAPTTVPAQSSVSFLPDFKTAIATSLFKENKIPFLLTNASNSWVTSPQKSVSGSAMLASDPHLETGRIAQFWYYAGIHIKDKNVNALGVTAAGLPLVVMGHNGHAAWAFTAGGVDVTEFYEEQIHEHDSTQYLTLDGWKKFETRKEEILVAGKESYKFSVFNSLHGPVFFKDKKTKKVYTIDWAGFDADINLAITSGFDLISVNNFQDFRQAVTQFGALDANWTYADKEGNIGYQLGTPIPVREKNWKNLPVKGWENNRVWDGYYPLEKTPHAFNPQKGWLASANNKQAADDFGYEILGNFAGDRIVRLEKLLSSKEKYSVQDFMLIQNDIIDETLLLWANKLVSPLKDFGAEGITMSNKLSSWDGHTGIESNETAFINVFQQLFKKNIFADELGKNHRHIEDVWLLEIFDKNTLHWFDDISTADIVESRDQIIKKTLKETLEMVKGKSWGQFQAFTMQHPFTVVPILGDLLDLKHGPWSWPGTEGTLNSSFSSYEDGNFKVVVGPSWRFIIDFANPDVVQMVLPAGNSGNPMSPYFTDFLELWKTGQYWNVPLSQESVYSDKSSVLVLTPINDND
ncbi:MAG: penicillin acylase family protein [Calditrichaeota bacterium]|nr:MAG: penicillin acylase family protein [Calditrichota bacterium]MBL1206099.1 penicillin acylase family protein [Calditrichota bacterium]NOG45925.1 penicillin acylase family protein [Calditrichota bacterium]